MCVGCNKCGQCPDVVRATAAVDGANLTITLPDTDTIMNGDVFRFCIINAIDDTNPTGTVSVIVNGTTFALKTKYGNDVRIDQLTNRKIYVVGVGAQTPTMTMLTCIPETSFSFPTYSV